MRAPAAAGGTRAATRRPRAGARAGPPSPTLPGPPPTPATRPAVSDCQAALVAAEEVALAAASADASMLYPLLLCCNVQFKYRERSQRHNSLSCLTFVAAQKSATARGHYQQAPPRKLGRRSCLANAVDGLPLGPRARRRVGACNFAEVALPLAQRLDGQRGAVLAGALRAPQPRVLGACAAA